MAKGKKEGTSLESLNIFATILTAVLAILTLTDDDFNWLQKWYVAAGVVIAYLIINRKKVLGQINKLKSNIDYFLNIVIEYRRGHLEFLDLYGKKAMYNEECLFNRIRRKETYTSSIKVDGQIDNEIHTYNCYNSLNHSKNKIAITYGKKRTNKDIVHNKRQLHFGYVVTLKDSYPLEDEFWNTEFKHYTKVYELKMSFHKDNPPRDVGLFNVTSYKNGKEKLTPLPVDPLVMQKYERIVLKIKLLHLQKGDKFRVCWKWNKPKKEEEPL